MNPTEAARPCPVASPKSSAQDDPRVVRALEEYAAVRKAGPRPDRQAFLANYPEIAAALADCLDGLDFIQTAVPLLHQAVADFPDSLSEELQPEAPLGDYRLIREIGRGGMGVVYEAVQISLGRRVALKVLPFAAALDGKQLQRFKNEAQAASHLHHQNIVPVYGVGCDRGVHYYSMQFIDGQTLSALIHELRHTGSPSAAPRGEQTGPYMPGPEAHQTPADQTITPRVAAISTERSTRNPALFRTLARLGVQAAEALEHAHALGVIHRDIKPANLMVDLRGNLWITDFGLAHCQSQAGLTMTGDLVGTLRYMSPEQALAKRVLVDQRTDIYSLGATLYELLALEPPFAGSDRQELLRQIAFEEPRPLRRLNKAIPAELETIVLKAIEKNPNERYASAQELADDLERFRKDEPIRAKRPTLLQRMQRGSRRHRAVVWTAGVAGVGVLLVALLAGALLIWREMHWAESAYKAEVTAHHAEARQRRRAEENLGKVLDTVDQILVEVGEKELASSPHLEPVRRLLLEKALKIFEGFLQEQSDEPAVRLQTATAHRRMGELYRQLGQHQKAKEALDRSIDLLAQWTDQFPDAPAYRQELARAYFSRGALLQLTGPQPEAEQAHRQALALQLRLVADHPHQADYRNDLTSNLSDLGCVLTNTGRSAEAEKTFRQARDAAENLAKDFPHVAEYRKQLTLCEGNLANELYHTDRMKEAEKSYRRTIEVAEQVVKEFPRERTFERNVAEGYTYLGNLLSSAGRLRDAETAHRRAVTLLTGLADDFPNIPRFRQGLGGSHNNLASVLLLTPRSQEAEQIFRQALDVQEKLAAEFPRIADYQSHLAGTLHNLALVYRGRREPDKARTLLEQAILRQHRALAINPSNPRYRAFEFNHYAMLASILTPLKAPAAEEMHRKAIDLAKKLAADFPNVAEYQNDLAIALEGLAILLRDQGKLEQARPRLEEAVRCQKATMKIDPRSPVYPRQLVNHYIKLARILGRLHQADLAEEAGRQALAVAREMTVQFPTEPPVSLARAYDVVGDLLQETERSGELEQAYRNALGRWKKLAADTPDDADYQEGLGHTRFNLAILSSRRGEPVEFVAHLEEAILHLRIHWDSCPVGPCHDSLLFRAYSYLASALIKLGKHDRLAEAAEELSCTFSESWRAHYDAHRFLASGIALALKDPDLTPEERQERAREYTRRIYVCLWEASRRNPEPAEVQNQLAWFLTMCPDHDFRDAARAVQLAGKAVAQSPGAGDYWGALGMAHYRAGDWKAARAALNKGRQLRKGGTSSDWFLLAMVHWKLNNKAEARGWYTRAVGWMDANHLKDETLRLFRAEAEELLGVKDKKE